MQHSPSNSTTIEDDSGPAVRTAITPQARLVAAEAATTAGPDDVTKAPKIDPNPTAIDAYVNQATTDAKWPGFDEHTHNPVQPSRDLVLESAKTPMVRLGERFHTFHNRYTSGLLGHVSPEEVSPKQVLSGMKYYVVIGVVVLLAAITVEVIYGSTAATLLSRQEYLPHVHPAAIAATLIFNGAAWFFTGIAYRRNPHLARDRGISIAIFGFVAIALPVIILGLVIGGWNGPGGNSSISNQATVEAAHRPFLALAYITLVVLATIATSAGHYLLLDTYHVRKIDQVKMNEKAARDASLTPAQQQETARRLAQAYLDTIPVAHHHSETRVKAYNSAFAHRIDPEIRPRITELNFSPSDPEWKKLADSLANLRRAGQTANLNSEEAGDEHS